MAVLWRGLDASVKLVSGTVCDHPDLQTRGGAIVLCGPPERPGCMSVSTQYPQFKPQASAWKPSNCSNATAQLVERVFEESKKQSVKTVLPIHTVSQSIAVCKIVCHKYAYVHICVHHSFRFRGKICFIIIIINIVNNNKKN